MDQWINVAIEKNMKELSIFLSRKINISVCPRLLRLHRCKLEWRSGIKHPQSQKLILQLSLVEDLRFMHCKGLKDL